MNPSLLFSIVFGYFIVLVIVSLLTSKNASQKSFFNANKAAPWPLVAFGMIGATLSGVTFISVPGEVGNSAFSYLQFILGNLVGYWLIAFILIPVYYKMNLISIYSFLNNRFGKYSHKTGSFFFLLSKTIGAAFRLYLVAMVLQLAFFDAWGIPFSITVCISILLIWVYTYRGGIKTIVWTDTLQTIFLISAVLLTIWKISSEMNLSVSEMFQTVHQSELSNTFTWNWQSPNNFFKQFFAGMFMTIVIAGMDQDMMQKNLACKNKKEAQKNMLSFSILFVFIVLLFLSLGVLLYQFASTNGITIPDKSDDLYPLLALWHLGTLTSIAFLLGITAAAYSSADSALTALTTSFCIDFLGYDEKSSLKKKKIRKLVHFGFSFVLIIVIILFKSIHDDSVVIAVFKAASYTYGPLLGLFIFGLFTQWKIKDKWVPLVAILSPLFCYLISSYSESLFSGYQFGLELLIMNGLLTFGGLFLLKE